MRKYIPRLMVIALLVVFLVSLAPINSQNETETHIVKVGNNYFSPQVIEIEVGDKLRFEWEEGAEGHNIVQTETPNSINPLDGGFSSGKPSNAPFTFEVTYEYTSNDTTLYFMCEPHATSGMLGEIIIGTGGSQTTEVSISQYIFLSLILMPSIYKMKKYARN